MLTRHIYVEIGFNLADHAVKFVEETYGFPQEMLIDIASDLDLSTVDAFSALYPGVHLGYTAFVALKESSIVMHTYAERARVVFDFVVHDSRKQADQYAMVCCKHVRQNMPKHEASLTQILKVTNTWR